MMSTRNCLITATKSSNILHKNEVWGADIHIYVYTSKYKTGILRRCLSMACKPTWSCNVYRCFCYVRHGVCPPWSMSAVAYVRRGFLRNLPQTWCIYPCCGYRCVCCPIASTAATDIQYKCH